MIKPKLTLGDKLVAGMLILGLLIVTISILSSKHLDQTNTELITGHLSEIKKNIPARGSLNYDIFLNEDNEHYKIVANWADCFNYDDFNTKVSNGNLISIRIEKSNDWITNSNLRLIVALSSGDRSYLDIDCVNASIGNYKKWLPIYWIIAITIGIIFWDRKIRRFK